MHTLILSGPVKDHRGAETAETSAPVVSQSYRLVWIESHNLLRLVESHLVLI